MAFRDRIEVVVDFVTDPAKKGLTQLKADMAAADGVMGKAKVAATGLGSALSAYAAPAAATAAVAFAEFARRSVTAFQDTALAAGQFSDATGIAVEDASRWIAVGDDVGISADTIQGAFLKMNRAISAGAFEKYGIEVKRAADGTVDANATFQNTVTTIGAMSDATERAKVAQELFGRGYAGIARIMEMDAASLSEALSSVSDGQIIDEEESRKARDFQQAMDNLQDSAKEVMLALGEGLVPALSAVADGATTVLKPVLALNDALDNLILGGGPMMWLFNKGKDLWDKYGEAVMHAGDETYYAAKDQEAAAAAADELNAAMGPMAESMGIAADSARDLRDSVQEAYDQIIGLADNRRSFERAMEGYTDSLTDLGGAMLDAESTAEDLEDKTRDTADAAIDAAKEYATMEGAALNSKEGHERLLDTLGYMIDTLDPNSPLRRELEAYKRDLEDIPEEISTEVRVTYVGDGLVVDENGNVRQPRGRSTVTGQSVPVAPVMPVMPESGSEAWFAMADAAFKAGQTLEEYFQTQLDGYEQQVELYENQYELGLVDRDTFLQWLKDKQAGLVRYSDEWMRVQRDIQRIEDQAEAERDDAREAEREESRQAREDARAEAEANYELAQSRQDLRDANADFLDVIRDPGASDADKDAAGEAYAKSIVAHLAARAAALGMRAYGVRWARFMRKRIEKQIAKQAQYSEVVKYLRIELLRIPDFSNIDDGEGADDPGTPGQDAATPGAPGTRPGLAPTPGLAARSAGGVNITVNAGLGADGQQIGREVVKALRNYQLVNGPLPIKVA